MGFRRSLPDVGVFAVEPDAVQVAWWRLDAGRHTLAAVVDGARTLAAVEVEADGGPGSVVLDGLPPATEVTLTLDGRPVDRAATLVAPPGEELCRFATVSDTHIGGAAFGLFPRIAVDPAAHDDCLREAIDDLRAWGASLLAVKGDITEQGSAAEWARAAALLRAAGMPVESIPGNHDVDDGARAGIAAFAAAGLPLTVGGVSHHDLPGIRVVLVDSTIPGSHAGALAARTEAVCDLLAGAGPAMVLLHQHLDRWPFTTHWPPGVPAGEARTFLDAVAGSNPDVILSSGHTHRHRARRHGPLTVTEVGAPKDFPGTWAGYAVHEGGIRQVVRRVGGSQSARLAADASRTFAGAWARWAPGARSARCFSVDWRGPRPGPGS